MHPHPRKLHLLSHMVVYRLSVLTNISRSGAALAAAKSSIIPHKYVNTHGQIVIEPLVLVVGEFVKPSIRVAQDHDRELPVF